MDFTFGVELRYLNTHHQTAGHADFILCRLLEVLYFPFPFRSMVYFELKFI